MIDLKALRDDPARFRDGCARKAMPVDLDQPIHIIHFCIVNLE